MRHRVRREAEERAQAAKMHVKEYKPRGVKDGAADALGGEHLLDEGFEFHVAVVHGGGDGPAELHLVGLEAGQVSAGILVLCRHMSCERQNERTTDDRNDMKEGTNE